MDDFGYINARIRAKKERLLKRNDFEELILSPDFNALTESLLKTEYGKDIEKGEITLETLIRGINRNFSRTITEIINFSSGEPRELLYVLLSRFLVSNIRAIIRGKLRKLSKEEIETALFPVLGLDEAKLNALLSKETASEVLELLLSFRIQLPFVISSALLRKVREEDIDWVENYLERSYYEWAMGKVEKGNGNREFVRYMLNSWADLKNIISTCLYLRYGISPAGKIKPLPFGFLSEYYRKRLLMSQNLKDAAEILSSTRYRELAKLLVEEKEPLLSFEKRFEEVLSLWAIKGFIKDPLSIAIPLAFIIAKYNEIVNLRVIIYGKYHGLEVHEIRKEVLFL